MKTTKRLFVVLCATGLLAACGGGGGGGGSGEPISTPDPTPTTGSVTVTGAQLAKMITLASSNPASDDTVLLAPTSYGGPTIGNLMASQIFEDGITFVMSAADPATSATRVTSGHHVASVVAGYQPLLTATTVTIPTLLVGLFEPENSAQAASWPETRDSDGFTMKTYTASAERRIASTDSFTVTYPTPVVLQTWTQQGSTSHSAQLFLNGTTTANVAQACVEVQSLSIGSRAFCGDFRIDSATAEPRFLGHTVSDINRQHTYAWTWGSSGTSGRMPEGAMKSAVRKDLTREAGR